MKRFLIALQFLTILPVKIKLEIEQSDFGKSLLYFPLIGMLIGTLLSLSLFLLGGLPRMVRAIFILIMPIIITGGIHLDGFADTCDGFYGARPKEVILQIMRDSQIGVMGVIGLVCILLLKFSLIASIPQNILWRPLIMMMAFSRWTQVLGCYMSSYPREDGKAKYFIEYDSKKEFLAGVFFVIVLFLLLAGLKGLVLLVLSLAMILLFINYVKKRIDGMTGDTIGATSEIAEVLMLLFYLILQR